MDIKTYISAGRKLRDWVGFSSENRTYKNRLCIRRGVNKVDLDTLIYLLMDEHLSELHQTKLYNALFNEGFSLFISISELADITESLVEQNPYYSEQDLVDSINYYFENRDFLELDS